MSQLLSWWSQLQVHSHPPRTPSLQLCKSQSLLARFYLQRVQSWKGYKRSAPLSLLPVPITFISSSCHLRNAASPKFSKFGQGVVLDSSLQFFQHWLNQPCDSFSEGPASGVQVPRPCGKEAPLDSAE